MQPTAEPSRNTLTRSSGSPTSSTIRYLGAQDLIDLHKAVSLDFGGNQAHPGEIESPYGLTNSVQRPQTTIFGKDAYPTIGDKAAAFIFALLQNMPFRAGNRRVALAALVAFCELNNRALDGRILDEKALENVIKKAGRTTQQATPPEAVFHDLRELMRRAIV